jgi:hypothetical protein
VDNQLKEIWVSEGSICTDRNVLISDNSQFCVITGENPALYTIDGKLIMKFAQYASCASITKNGDLIGIRGEKGCGIYNAKGELVYKDAYLISPNGNVVMKRSSGKIDFYTVPEMIKRADVKANGMITGTWEDISADGKIALFYSCERGKGHDMDSYCLVNTETGEIYAGVYPHIKKAYLTRDGRYASILCKDSDDNVSIYYLQVIQ